jgi:hypothetical protein
VIDSFNKLKNVVSVLDEQRFKDILFADKEDGRHCIH